MQNEIFFIKVWATFFLRGYPSRYPIFNFQCENHFFVLERVIEMNVMIMAMLEPCVFGAFKPFPDGDLPGGRAKRACMQIFVMEMVWDYSRDVTVHSLVEMAVLKLCDSGYSPPFQSLPICRNECRNECRNRFVV